MIADPNLSPYKSKLQVVEETCMKAKSCLNELDSAECDKCFEFPLKYLMILKQDLNSPESKGNPDIIYIKFQENLKTLTDLTKSLLFMSDYLFKNSLEITQNIGLFNIEMEILKFFLLNFFSRCEFKIVNCKL